MNQFSPETLKTLIELGNSINSDYSDKGALLFRILRAAMRLVKCELYSFLTYEPGTRRIKIVASLAGGEEKKRDVELDGNCAEHEVFIKGNVLSAEDIEDDLYYAERIGERLSVRVSSFLCIPVFIEKRPVCILELVNKDQIGRASCRERV